MRFRSITIVASGLLIAACAREAEPPADETMSEEVAVQEFASPTAEIAELADSYEEYINSGQASMVGDLYTEDAVFVHANTDIDEGREAIIASTGEFVAAFSPVLTINPIEQVGVGDWVVDRGSYSEVLSPEGDETVTLTGNYMSLSQRTDDGLKLHRLNVHFDAPPPIPLPEPEPREIVALAGSPVADLIASYQEHYNMGHASVVSDLYTDDAVAMYAERGEVNGPAEIQTVIEGLMSMGDGSPQLTITEEEAVMLGEGWAIDRGSFTVERTVEGEALSRSGTYMILARQADDGSWEIQWGISSIAPLPAADM